MLETYRVLSESDLSALAELERRVVGHDGGRLKLEWSTLRSRSGDWTDDLFWRADGRVLGFAGLYLFGADLELTGMVDPAVRRTGIATRLLDRACALAQDRGRSSALLVVPRNAAGGADFARAQSGTPEHSEHHLVLGATPEPRPGGPAVTVRRAAVEDSPEVLRILAEGFGEEPIGHRLDAGPDEPTLVVERDSVIVGTMRVNRENDSAGIYGFTVDPRCQGQGIGRAALQAVCAELRADSVNRVTLEVEVANDRALDLYLSVGFVREATDDYFTIVTRRPDAVR